MRKFDITIFIFSIIAAFIAYFTGELIFKSLYQNIADELLIGLYFSIVGAIIIILICLCVYKLSKLKDEIPANNIFLKSLGILTSITVILCFILGAGFEFLYSFNPNSNKISSNYIVAIDNSGSMETNDPHYERFDALNELFSSIKSNQKMGVYVFNSGSENIIELQNIDKSNMNKYQQILNQYKISDGGTELMKTLREIINYIETNNVKGGTSVVVISDGECDVDYNLLNNFQQKNIPIHTIGISSTFNSLNDISAHTNGIYYDIGDTYLIRETFTKIYNLQSDRTLITERTGTTSGMLLYIIMRIIFIFILILIIKVIELFIIDIKSLRKSIMFQSILFSIIASILMEFILQNSNINESLIRFLMILCASILFVSYLSKINYTKNTIPQEFKFNPTSTSTEIEQKRNRLK